MNLVTGQIYKRTDLHEYFGGQRQGGISTPSQNNNILIFSNDRGDSFGYDDGWRDDNIYLYTGEGQVGDMSFTRGNLAIRDHAANGKKIYLFIYVRKAHVECKGEMTCIDSEYFTTKDRSGNQRLGIRFHLEKASGAIPEGKPLQATPTPSSRKPSKTESQGLITSRVGQGYYRQEVLIKFDQRCAVTGAEIPGILIASHIVPWREADENERLDPENGILLSPLYDALFDKHLISFDDSGHLLISALLDSNLLQSLRVDQRAKIKVTEGMKKYLKRHRKHLK
jgi:5-methylcytosine-specific restriction enzyme A